MEEKPTETTSEPLGRSIWKYFLHGIAFYLIFLVMLFGWAVLLVLLVLGGLFIGLIIGFLLLFLILGYINAGITGAIWHVTVKTDWKSAFVHGLALFVVLAIVGIPSVLANYAVPGIPTIIVLFLVYCPIYGFVARRVAVWWEDLDDSADFDVRVDDVD